jgi:hypothetical protein
LQANPSESRATEPVLTFGCALRRGFLIAMRLVLGMPVYRVWGVGPSKVQQAVTIEIFKAKSRITTATSIAVQITISAAVAPISRRRLASIIGNAAILPAIAFGHPGFGRMAFTDCGVVGWLIAALRIVIYVALAFLGLSGCLIKQTPIARVEALLTPCIGTDYAEHSCNEQIPCNHFSVLRCKPLIVKAFWRWEGLNRQLCSLNAFFASDAF